MSTSRFLRRWGVFVATAVAVGAGLAAGLGHWHWQADREAGDRLRAAAAREVTSRESEERGWKVPADLPPPGEELRALLGQKSRVVLDPSLASSVAEDDLRRAEKILDDSGKPLRLAFMRDHESISGPYSTRSGAARWAYGVGEAGHYVVLWPGGLVDQISLGVPEDYLDETGQGQPSRALVRIAEAMTALPVASSAPDEDSSASDEDEWLGPERISLGEGLLVVLVVLLAVVVPAHRGLVFLVSHVLPAQPRTGETK